MSKPYAYFLVVEDEEDCIQLHLVDGLLADHLVGREDGVAVRVEVLLLQGGRIIVLPLGFWSIYGWGRTLFVTRFEHLHETALRLRVLLTG